MGGPDYPQPYGEYVLLERLGVGGMSAVDLARKAVEDAEYVRFVVIKRIKAERSEDEAFVRMFKDEARITAELNHSNIAHVYDFGRQGDEYYMALEYVPGTDLRRVVNALRRSDDTLPLRVGLKMLYDVLEGLGYAHSRADTLGRNMNIVHRDVNPRNVMISTRGEVKVIDFGVAKATHRLERTRTDHVKGKFAYMAPEQIQASDIDRRADLFAVGLMLHEIVTGYGPFYGLSQVQIMHRLLSGRLPDLPAPPELADPEPLQAVHRKALALDPDDRYQSAREFQEALVEVAEPLGGLASQDEVAELLHEIDPHLEDRILEKVSSYTGKIPQGDMATVPLPSTLATTGDVAPPEGSSRSTVTRTQIVAGGMAVGLGGLLMILAGLGVGAFLALGGPELLRGGEPDLPELGLAPAADQADAESGVATDDEAVTDSEPGAAADDEAVADAEPGAAADDEAVADTAPGVATDDEAVADPAPVEAAADGGTAGDAPGDSTPAGGASGQADVATGESVDEAPAPGDAGDDEASTRRFVVRERGPVDDDPGEAEEPAPEPAPDEPIVLTPDDEPGSAEPEATADAAPEPEPEPPAKTGTLMVTSDPKGLPIAIDGEPIGEQTPATFEWPVGDYMVEAGGKRSAVTVLEGMRKTVVLK